MWDSGSSVRFFTFEILDINNVPVTTRALADFQITFLRNGAACSDALTFLNNGDGTYKLSYTPSGYGQDVITVYDATTDLRFTDIEDLYDFASGASGAGPTGPGSNVGSSGTACCLNQDFGGAGWLKPPVSDPTNYRMLVFSSSDWLGNRRTDAYSYGASGLDSAGNWSTAIYVPSGTYYVVAQKTGTSVVVAANLAVSSGATGAGASGSSGTGSQGATGATGPQGPVGPGSGATGATGPQGPAGGSSGTSSSSGGPSFIPLQTPTLVNGVSGGNLGSSGYTYVEGKYLFSTADNVGGAGTQGSFSIFDVSKVSVSVAPTLVGQIVSPSLLYAEGLWVDPTCSHAVVCVMGGDPAGTAQLANASVKVISVAACIAAYEAQSAAVEPSVIVTLTDSVKLSSPENLLMVETASGWFGYVSNVFSTGTNDYTVINFSSFTAPVVGISISSSYLAGAVYAVYLGTTIYCTNRSGFPTSDSASYLTAIDITTPSAPAITGVPLNCSGTWLTGVEVGYYSEYDKIFAFVAQSEASGIVVADVTNVAAMKIVATLTDSTSFNQPSNVHKIGSILFSTAYGVPSGITETDVSNPYIPRVVSFTSTTALGLSGTQEFDHLFIRPGDTRGYQSDTSATGGVYVIELGTVAVDAAPSPALIPATLTLMKVTDGGSNGSITISATGRVTAYTAPS
jgi:hypothetical protein